MVLSAVLHQLTGDMQQAKSELGKALQQGRLNPLINLVMGNIYAAEKNFGKASESLKISSGALPGFQVSNLEFSDYINDKSSQPATQLNLAIIYLLQGWGQRAIDIIDTVPTAHKNNLLANYLSGKAHRLAGNVDDAIARFQTAKAIEPKFISAYTELGKIYFEQEDYDKALVQYKQIAQIDSKGELIDPVEIHTVLGSLYEKTGDDKRAIDEYKQVIRISPDNAFVHNQLGWLYGTSAGDLDKAVTHLKKACELLPNRPVFFDNLGWMYYQKRDYQKAIEALKQAAELLPRSPTVLYHLGMAYYKNGEAILAEEHLKQALSISSDFSDRLQAEEALHEIQDR
jgi:tetratricopeptide (TPR) repeat protein